MKKLISSTVRAPLLRSAFLPLLLVVVCVIEFAGAQRLIGAPPTTDSSTVSSDDGGGYLNGPGDQINVAPLLGALQDNGGHTFTHELLPGSPAINAGDPNFIGPPDYDQRGPNYYRVRGGRIDVGAFEVQEPPTPTPTPRVRTTPAPRLRPSAAPRP